MLDTDVIRWLATFTYPRDLWSLSAQFFQNILCSLSSSRGTGSLRIKHVVLTAVCDFPYRSHNSPEDLAHILDLIATSGPR